MSPKRKIFATKRWQSVLGWIGLVSFCISVMPIPIILPSVKSIDGQAYFCQDRPCGCASAEQCWTHCCCATQKEQLDWAEKKGVSPPAYAAKSTSEHPATKNEKSCCSNSKKIADKRGVACNDCNDFDNSDDSDSNLTASNTCEKVKKPTEKTYCESKQANAYNKELVREQMKKKPGRLVVSMFAMKCQGKSSSLCALPWFILPPPMSVVACDAPTTEPWGIQSRSWHGQRPCPDPPPPRCGLCSI
jgi:hypothetical protein